MAKREIEFEGGVPDWAVDLLVEVIVHGTKTKIPKPVIYSAVKGVALLAPSLDADDVRAILERLGAPVSYVRDIWNKFTVAAAEESCEVECPESGDTIVLEEGDGFYPCPDCKQEIEVDDGVGYHPFLVDCPVESSQVWVKAEEDTYECAECGLDIVVANDRARHERAKPARRSRPAPRKSRKKARK